MDSLHGWRISQQVSKPQSTSFNEALTNEALTAKFAEVTRSSPRSLYWFVFLGARCEYSVAFAVKGFSGCWTLSPLWQSIHGPVLFAGSDNNDFAIART